MFSIITDASGNLPGFIIKRCEITVMPFPYFINGVEYSSADIDAFDADKYYSEMKNSEITTSQICPQQYMTYMERELKENRDVLVVCVSSGVSGTYNSAVIAANQLAEEYPDRKILIVDSLGAGLGMGFLAVWASEYRSRGMSIENTYDEVLKIRQRVRHVFMVDDLKHLRRSGRISGTASIMGTMLHIKPILKGSEEGKIVPCGKVRGRLEAVKALAKDFITLAVNPEEQMVGITHAGCRADAEKLAAMLNEKGKPKEIVIVNHEPATGSHLGPGALALYFLGDERARFA